MIMNFLTSSMFYMSNTSTSQYINRKKIVQQTRERSMTNVKCIQQ